VTIDEAIATVREMANGRTRYYGQEPFLDEVLVAEIERLRKQLPEGMGGCTIILHRCEKGHGWLSAENWIQHGCPTCEIERLREVERLIKGLLTAGARK